MTPPGRSTSLLFLRVTLAAAAIVVAAAGVRCEEKPRAQGALVEVVRGALRARLPDGSVREGAALVGATLVVAAGAQTLTVRIAGVERDPRDPRGEVLLYDFRVISPTSDEQPLCNPDPDGRLLGLPLAGRSDAAGFLFESEGNNFELVCTSGPQGKCVRFGYAPWRQAPDGRSMRDWFNACVRMMRGDYCGDDHPFTRDGTWIDIYDHIGVQKSDEDPSLSFEAAWSPTGAICVAHTRVPDIITLDGLAKACPRLTGHLGPGLCSENAVGALIFNRSR